MQKLTDLTLEQLLALYDECIEAHEQQISDECFKRYGISLTESNQTWWQRNNFFIGLIYGMLLLIPINVIVVLIEDYT